MRLGIINVTAGDGDHCLGLQKRGRVATSPAWVSRARWPGAGGEWEMPRGSAAAPQTGSFLAVGPAGTRRFLPACWAGTAFFTHRETSQCVCSVGTH